MTGRWSSWKRLQNPDSGDVDLVKRVVVQEAGWGMAGGL